MPDPGRTNRRKSSLAKLIDKYYADLAAFAQHNVLFEMGTRPAFHALLAARAPGWAGRASQCGDGEDREGAASGV